MIALVLEASTYAGSVALFRDRTLLGDRSLAMRGRESEALLPAVGELLSQVGVRVEAIGRIVCGAGPGAFTSLRIAGGIAKGIALAVGAELVPVSSLALLVGSLDEVLPGRYLATADALRGQWYAEPFEMSAEGVVRSLGAVRIVERSALEAWAHSFGGDVIGGGLGGALGGALGAESSAPRARGAARLATLVEPGGTADLASWEPSYGRLAEAQVKWEAEHGRPLARG